MSFHSAAAPSVRSVVRTLALLATVSASASLALAQQKPQWLPGQFGLNAGILPAPGFTYSIMSIDYRATTFHNGQGDAIPVTGRYDVWAFPNYFIYVLHDKRVLGANYGMLAVVSPATGSLVADVDSPRFPDLRATAGGSGLGDLWLQPFNLGWHLKRADLQVMNGFEIPTGRFRPGATNNVGAGYFGNHFQTGSTLYLTQDRGTSANLFTDWEVHGRRDGVSNTSKVPGQAFTTEWGIGQLLPLSRDTTRFLQIGVIGYDQWQITRNRGTLFVDGKTIPARSLAPYSVHAIGGELNYILLPKRLSVFTKYEREYDAHAHTLGGTFVFGGSATWPTRQSRPTH